MIAVVLDSNIMYGDPYFATGNLKRLLAYSTLEKIDVLISSVVIEEVINNAMNRLEDSMEKVASATKTINDLGGTQAITKIQINLGQSEKDLREKFRNLIMAGTVNHVSYSDELLPELVRRAVNKIRPFKEKKEEFRDAVIWLSCVEYLKNKEYSAVYLITNNVSDFGGMDGELHEELVKDYPAKLYLSLKVFFENEKDTLSKFIPTNVTEGLMEWLSLNELDDYLIHDELDDHFREEINERLHADIMLTEISEALPGESSGYVTPADLGEITVLNYEYYVDVDSVIVAGQFAAREYIQAYRYNPNYDQGDEKYEFVREVEMSVQYDFMFSLSPDQEGAYDFEITDCDMKFT